MRKTFLNLHDQKQGRLLPALLNIASMSCRCRLNNSPECWYFLVPKDSIDKALEIKDYGTIKIAAHSLKPQLSYMGVKEDVSNIFMIEQAAGQPAHFDELPNMVTNLKRLCNKAFEELRSN